MGFAIVLEQSLSYYGTTKQLVGIVKDLTGGKLNDVLNAVGKTHMEAGFRAFRDAAISSTPEEPIRDARGKFRDAYEFFSKETGGILGFFGDADHENMYKAALMIALCNHYFGDYAVTNRYLDYAQSSFDKYFEHQHFVITDRPRGSRGEAAYNFPTVAASRRRAIEKLEAEKAAVLAIDEALRN
jgi:hypothetical protein